MGAKRRRDPQTQPIQPINQDPDASTGIATEAEATYTKHAFWKFVFPAFALLGIVIPLSVHAGLLSSFTTPVTYVSAQKQAEAARGNVQTMALLQAALHTDPNPAKGGGDVCVEEGALAPCGQFSDIDDTNSRTSNGEISLYEVRHGDTLSQIAEMFGVSANTILWANDLKSANLIQPGKTLVILPITGVRHIVKDGDTLKSIAKKYGGEDDVDAIIEDILAYNQLASASDISVGDTVVIPGGAVTPPPSAAPAKSSGASINTVAVSGGGSGDFAAPLASYTRTQGIHGYNAVDLAAPSGATIRAVAAGTVIVAKVNGAWNGGYGNYVVIKHANGVQTLYAHMLSGSVSVGQSVSQGQAIGQVGNTGRSTGSHLHLEVRGARNPF